MKTPNDINARFRHIGAGNRPCISSQSAINGKSTRGAGYLASALFSRSEPRTLSDRAGIHLTDFLPFKGIIRPGLPLLKGRRYFQAGVEAKLAGTQYLYVFRCERFYKVGISNSPVNRLASLQDCNPFPVEPVGYSRMPRSRAKIVEGLIHVELSDFWHRNEWFAAPPERVAAAIKAGRARFLFLGFDVARKVVYDQSPVLRRNNPNLPKSRLSRGLAGPLTTPADLRRMAEATPLNIGDKHG